MLEDMLDDNEGEDRKLAIDQDKIQQALTVTVDRNFSISCELGVRYPMLKAMLNREDLHLRVSVCPLIMYGIYQFIDVILQFYTWYIIGKLNINCVLHCDAASAFQGNTGTSAPSLDVMMLKQQFFSESGANNGREQTFQYAFRQHHPNLQFLPQKLGEWVAKNMADELNLPVPDCGDDDISSACINRILTQCLVSNRKGDNLHTYHTVEFESDLYRGVMRARCYPFDMDKHRFRGKIVKVCVIIRHMINIFHKFGTCNQ